MDIQAYINSGILEEYFLGILDEERSREVAQLSLQYPELATAFSSMEDAFRQYSLIHTLQPPAGLEDRIWMTLENLNKEKLMDINDLPLINSFSNSGKWLGLVKPFIPAQVTEDRIMHVLQNTGKVFQAFVISKTDFEDETHDELLESFILLEGECECTVGDEVYRVKAGGYTSIPLHVPHTVRILSPYVLAIMQRVAV